MGAKAEINDHEEYAPGETTEVRARAPKVTVPSARLEELVRVAGELARDPSESAALRLCERLEDLLAIAIECKAEKPRRARHRSSPGKRGADDPIEALTTRERAVFTLLVGGLSNEGAARQLQISKKTVQTHRAKINEKLGVHCPGQLVRFAALRGLIAS